MSEESTEKVSIKKKKSLMTALSAKKRRTSTLKLEVDGTMYEWTFQALPALKADQLRGEHPATAAQKRSNPNAVLNLDTYHPAFIAACSLDPKISEEEAAELFKNDGLSAGELESILAECYKVNNEGLGVPFTEGD